MSVMDEFQRERRRILLFGTIAGGGTSAAVFFLIDMMFADMQQGTWRDAIAKDLNNLFHASLSTSSIPVIAVYLVVLMFLVAFGAFLGIVFFLFLDRFFSFLKSD